MTTHELAKELMKLKDEEVFVDVSSYDKHRKSLNGWIPIKGCKMCSCDAEASIELDTFLFESK